MYWRFWQDLVLGGHATAFDFYPYLLESIKAQHALRIKSTS
jgi:hypothetical protein